MGFDIERLRKAKLANGYVRNKEEKLTTGVGIRKPGKKEWVCVRTEEEWCLRGQAAVEVEIGKIFVLDPDIVRAEVLSAGDFFICDLHAAMNSSGGVFLWPVRHGDSSWAQSAQEAVEYAKESAVRVVANQGAGKYDVFRAITAIEMPPWPADLTFEKLCEKAFKEAYVDSDGHAVLKHFLGDF